MAKNAKASSADQGPRLNRRQLLAWLRREVFAVPGSPLDPRAAGTNDLLRQGACLVTSSRDIVETLAPILGRPRPAPAGLASCDEHKTPAPLPDIGRSEREIVVAALGPSPVDIDDYPGHRISDANGPDRAAQA